MSSTTDRKRADKRTKPNDNGAGDRKDAGAASGGSPPTSESIKALQKLIGPPVWELKTKRKWLVEGFVQEASLSLLIGEVGKGKSWVALELARCVAEGKAFLGHKVSQRQVLYVDGEMSAVDVKERLERIGVDFKSPGLKNRFIIWGEWSLDPSKGPGQTEILAFAKEHKPLIIFDSLVEWHPGDENNPTQTRAYMKLFKRLAHQCKATVKVLHHASAKGKHAKKGRGSTDIPAAVDVAFLVTSKEDRKVDDQGNRLSHIKDIRIEDVHKARSGRGFEVLAQFVPGEGLVRDDGPLCKESRESQEQAVLMFLAGHEGAGVAEVSEWVGESPKVTRAILAALVKRKLVQPLRKPTKGVKAQYRLAREGKVAGKVSDNGTPCPDVSLGAGAEVIH